MVLSFTAREGQAVITNSGAAACIVGFDGRVSVELFYSFSPEPLRLAAEAEPDDAVRLYVYPHRIGLYVNGELEELEIALDQAWERLAVGGRMAIISFHSLEDRPVKWFFKNRENVLEILTKKPVEPTAEECEMNPPSRSAKLRVVEKLEKERDPAKKRNKYRD